MYTTFESWITKKISQLIWNFYLSPPTSLIPSFSLKGINNVAGKGGEEVTMGRNLGP